MSSPLRSIAVLGAGSWGTALAIQLARSGRTVRLWGRDAAQLTASGAAGENTTYLPGCSFPASLQVEPDLKAALAASDEVLVVVPSHALRELLEAVRSTGEAPARISWATKGLEPGTGKLAHEVAGDVLGDIPMAVLSGPTFAKEVGAGLPTAITVAGEQDLANFMADALHGERFRAYTSSDIVGVEVGGSAKNVIAIGAGLSDGLGFGANARVALITRGLAEIARLAQAKGADPQTLMGLAGMGDLVLTCTDNQSRNRRMGLALASGKSQDDARKEIFQVVEGVSAAKEISLLAERLGVEMPITRKIYEVLYENLSPKEAVTQLFERERKEESI
ncbi:MAG: NAD(P)H-dependent glycerol-3-phosphate dehydrogenase [Gammaproteobacteria bacterium]|nr:NAD(P)H-dependent glycerol-3-phosphate dehydrogenase [Gammaproteobacteria bacterium]